MSSSPLATRARKPTDIAVIGASVYFLPVTTRVPLKFGAETLSSVICCRVQVVARDRRGRTATGWGETPLSVQWGWPSRLPHAFRGDAMQKFVVRLADAWAQPIAIGHPLELGFDFQHHTLPALLREFNATLDGAEMPYLAALICLSAFDLATHDAYGNLHEIDCYRTYTRDFMNRDLAQFIAPDDGANVDFRGQYPCDYLREVPLATLPVWHLVGGLDPLTDDEFRGDEPADGYPVALVDWIRSDGIRCLKVKLRGNDTLWDLDRLVRVSEVAFPLGAEHLTADFNCTVQHPEYVNEILDRLRDDFPNVFSRLLYVEQPFDYELRAHRLDVRSVAERKPLFLDESAHDWEHVRLGRSLGWTGVALKTCKTQTGSLLSGCWARAHGMQLMVQDLTNPMLAQIPHLRLAAHFETIMGVESNAMQFYPTASAAEEKVHPGLYQRRGGQLRLDSIRGFGFGYRNDEIDRRLPEPAACFGDA